MVAYWVGVLFGANGLRHGDQDVAMPEGVPEVER